MRQAGGKPGNLTAGVTNTVYNYDANKPVRTRCIVGYTFVADLADYKIVVICERCTRRTVVNCPPHQAEGRLYNDDADTGTRRCWACGTYF